MAPQVLGVLTRRFGDFETAEDAVQEALLAAAAQWPAEGVPDNPRGWLIQVAARRMTEQVRGEQARRRREDLVAQQAAINAIHDEAAKVEDTDWPQILALYGLLERMSGNPMVALNRAVAVAMTHGPATGLTMLDALEERLAGHHRLHAARAHLLEMVGDPAAAAESYRTAARLTTSGPERHYLIGRAARLTTP